MKKIYYVQAEDLTSNLSEEQLDQFYETEGMFDENGAVLGMWCQNDANWRSEYFNEFMKALGIEVSKAPKQLMKTIAQRFVDRFGY